MSDNQVNPNIGQAAPIRPKTKKEIMSADPDTLTTDELNRRALFIDIDHKELQQELTRRQTEKMKMTDAQNRDKFFSRGLELKKTASDQQRQQAKCSHRKGGRGLEALINGGNAPDYCFLKHLLPWNEWYIRCMRCGRTYKPVHAEDYDLKTAAGREAFEKDKAEYKWAMEAPTDNISSTGITFQHTSEDGNETAREFVHEVTKNTTLR